MRRAAARAGLYALVIAAGFSLTQCVQVADPVAGSTAQQFATSTSDCFSGCGMTYAAGVQAQTTLHNTNVKACKGDPVCLALENARFQAAMNQLMTDATNCRNGCHHQGGGTGGSANP
jgi:hypothetical protein